MKTLIAILGALLIGTAAAQAGDAPTRSAAAPPTGGVHRYLVERTFPAGALDGLDAALKAKVNANNAKFGVHWVMSYANAAKTKTYCVYEGPSEAATREAATANALDRKSVV